MIYFRKIIIVFIILISFVYYISVEWYPCFLEYDTLLNNEKNLAKPKAPPTNILTLSFDPEKILVHFVHLIEKEAFNIIDAEILKHDNNIFALNFTLSGPLNHMPQLLRRMFVMDFPVLIKNFNFKAIAENNKKIQLNLNIWNQHWVSQPFYAKHQIFSLNNLSFREIIWRGFLKRGNEYLAIGALPNGELSEIHVKDKIGKEQVLVKNILESGIDIEMKGRIQHFNYE